jgi:hypothetical protein
MHWLYKLLIQYRFQFKPHLNQTEQGCTNYCFSIQHPKKSQNIKIPKTRTEQTDSPKKNKIKQNKIKTEVSRTREKNQSREQEQLREKKQNENQNKTREKGVS